MKKLLVPLLLALAPSVALAQTTVPPLRTQVIGAAGTANLLSAVALNGSAASRTFTITNPNGGYAKATLEISRTRAAGTDFTMTCVSTVSSSATPTGARGTCSYDASGVCTHVPVTWKSSTSVTEVLPWEIAISGWARTDCTVASTSANGSDLVTITGMMVAQ